MEAHPQHGGGGILHLAGDQRSGPAIGSVIGQDGDRAALRQMPSLGGKLVGMTEQPTAAIEKQHSGPPARGPCRRRLRRCEHEELQLGPVDFPEQVGRRAVDFRGGRTEQRPALGTLRRVRAGVSLRHGGNDGQQQDDGGQKPRRPCRRPAVATGRAFVPAHGSPLSTARAERARTV